MKHVMLALTLVMLLAGCNSGLSDPPPLPGMGYMHLIVNPWNAELTLDGEPFAFETASSQITTQGFAHLEGYLEAGSHTLVGFAAGHYTTSISFEVLAGEEQYMSFDLPLIQ